MLVIKEGHSEEMDLWFHPCFTVDLDIFLPIKSTDQETSSSGKDYKCFLFNNIRDRRGKKHKQRYNQKFYIIEKKILICT